jgi:hypothetical protein
MMTITARFDGRVFVPEGPVDLPAGRRVQLVVEPAEVTPAVASPPLTGLMAELGRLPENPDWPADGAAQHDHYLYGTPKQP